MQHIEQCLFGNILNLHVKGSLHIVAIDSRLVHNGDILLTGSLLVSPSGFATQIVIVSQLDTVLGRIHLGVYIAQGTASQRTENLLALNIALGEEASAVGALAQHRQFLYLLVLGIRHTARIEFPITAPLRTSLAEGLAEFLHALVGEYTVQSLTDLCLMRFEKGVATMLRLDAATLIAVRHPEVHEERILRHTTGHQLSIVAEYVAALGSYGHTVDHTTLGHLLPVVTLENHHRHSLEQYNNAHHRHQYDDGEVA